MKKLLNYSLLMLLLCFVVFACSKESEEANPTSLLSSETVSNAVVGGYNIGCLKDEGYGKWSFTVQGPGNVQGAGLSHLNLKLKDCYGNIVPLTSAYIKDAKIVVGNTIYKAGEHFDLEYSDGSCTEPGEVDRNLVKYDMNNGLSDILKNNLATFYFTFADAYNNLKLSGAKVLVKTGNQNGEQCFYGHIGTCKDYCKVKENGCTYTQGYWKTHGPTGCAKGNNTNKWPVSSLTLGSRTYTAEQLCSILNEQVRGNGLVSLAHQLIAAKLNVANGASSSSIASSIAAADALIGNRVIPPVGNGSLAPNATSALTKALADYNEGITGPGHCD